MAEFDPIEPIGRFIVEHEQEFEIGTPALLLAETGLVLATRGKVGTALLAGTIAASLGGLICWKRVSDEDKYGKPAPTPSDGHSWGSSGSGPFPRGVFPSDAPHAPAPPHPPSIPRVRGGRL